ncbi:gliding motility-associated C-terminal domain-containing protein [Larkinella rosea]|uniref:Gliding motility-associated C-terminal domain-containing protein n=1 Tax=Larkinella rosea TaxID=2025312 RepID=A0A3P1BZW1_9BACT|nr:gliding motility-associated C-terminal domain-containing protein [Larkinella rosea]RRB06701.1 gliding motility-associated C-terminal domain-containing protein [Larkinella rosea]
MNLAKAVKHFSGISCVTFLIFLSLTGWGQDLCNLTSTQFTGSFQVNISVGCLPLKIKAASSLTNVKNVRYVYDYQGGAVKDADFTSDSVHIYQKPGLFRILQFSEQDNRQLRACVVIQVYDTIQPQIVLEPCLTRVLLKIPKASDYQYDFYTVTWGDGTYEQLDGKNPVGVHTFPDDSQRQIEVKGVHLYGYCGGTTRVTFKPNTQPIAPSIDRLRAVSANSIDLTIRNPGGNRFWIEQRPPGGTYVRTSPYSDALTSTIAVEADTTQAICFRLVLADTCLQTAPISDVCFDPQKPLDPTPVPDSTVFMPDAFSPNADGINDRFQLQGLLSGTAQLTVYNRWGEVVFRTDDAITGWDGRQRDQSLPPGTYSYLLDMAKPDGVRLQKRGAVVLVR